ncbi:MAG: hypothetical protein AB1690_10915 [Candidatus Zixiibacteriota bacterium]
MPDKKILLISYYFPPLGMGGVSRATVLHRYLPQYGYQVFTLTVKPILYPEYDHSRLASLNQDNIIRAGSLDPARLLFLMGKRKTTGRLIDKARSSFLFQTPDSKRFWNIFAYRRAVSLIRDKQIAAVISTSPPPSAHIIGQRLKKELGVFWMADFRDLWLSLPIEEHYRSTRARTYSQKLKEAIVTDADAVVAVNNDIRRYLGRGEVIMNGAEAEIRELWQESSPSESDCFTIGILGTINHLCPVERLFAAVAELDKKKPELGKKVRLLHVGHSETKSMQSLVDKFNIGDRFKGTGYLPHNEAITALGVADMLFFSVGKFSEYNILPGRIFDYLLSGKPILSDVPAGSDAEKLLKEYPGISIVTHGEIGAIAEALEDLATKRHPALPLPETYYSRFTTKALAAKFAELLDSNLK